MLVGTAMTGTPTSPPTTLGKAPSMPAHTIMTRASASTLAMRQQPMNARDSDVIEMLHAIAHQFGGDDRFFCHRNVAGARGNHSNNALSVASPIALQRNCARQRTILSLGNLRDHSLELFFGRTRGEHVAFMLRQAGEDPGHLRRRFAQAENHLGHALPQGAVMIHLRESQVFKWKMAEASNRLIGRELLGPDLIEQMAKRDAVHVETILEAIADCRIQIAD